MESEDRLFQELKRWVEESRSMEPGGDLDALINQGVGRVGQVLRQEMINARSQAADQAAFPPCGVSGVRIAADTPSGDPQASDQDLTGTDNV